MASIKNFVQPNNYIVAGASAIYSGQLTDLTAQNIGTPNVTALALTIIDNPTGTVVNSVSGTNILNTGRGTLNSAGALTITLTPADTAIATATNTFEVRSLIIDYTFGANVGRHVVEFGIVAAPGSVA